MYASKDGLGFWQAFLIALMFQFFLFGLCITLFPYVRGYIVDRAIEDDASSFLVQMGESEPEQSPTSTIPMAETEAATVPRDYERLWADMIAYNERIYAQHQSGPALF